MKKPERIAGFVEFENTTFPFEFNDDDFSLNIYPPTIEEWDKRSSPISFFQELSQYNPKEHKWVEIKQLKGKTHNHNNVIFSVGSDYGNDSGFITFKVLWYYYYTDELTDSNIGCFRISGKTVDYFHWPSSAMKMTLDLTEASKLSKIGIDLNDHNVLECGEYSIDETITLKITAESIVRYTYNSSQPVLAKSVLTTITSNDMNLDQLVAAIHNAICFFQYVTYRRNVNINCVEVGCITDNSLQNYYGIFAIRTSNQPIEDVKKAKEQVVRSSLMGEKIGSVFQLIHDNKIYVEHICESIEERRHYPPSRIVMIYAAFEREYANIYGKDTERSEEYLEVKAEVVKLIEQYSNKQTGKRRRHAKDLLSFVDSRDSSFAQNMQHAFKDCREILEPFVLHRNEGSYDEAVSSISIRMNKLRNGLVHSRLDIELEPVHLSDIKFVEELVYAMRFKTIEIDSLKCQCAINELFNEKFALS